MVKKMEIHTSIDAQGRILIPAEIRGKLHMEPNSEVDIVIQGHELLIKKANTNLEKQVNEWKEKLLQMKIEAGIAPIDAEEEETGKWMDEEYVEKKLGLR